MISEAPPFWWTEADWRARLLYPISLLYGAVAGWRMRNASRNAVSVPVICVGNFTVGGAGKTPTALAIGRAASARGLKPGFLSRGYGGTLDVTTIVDPEHHRAVDTGDEPLLLAREGVTVITRRRIAGARLLVEQGVDLIIMDDGFQSNTLLADVSLVVVDSYRGIGNGHVMPGGPVRAPISTQMNRLSAILKVGDGPAADALVRRASRAGRAVHIASVKPRQDAGLAGARVLAFAGIADHGKFYRTLESLGATIVERRDFADHQHLGDDEIDDLLAKASAENLQLVTTAKDIVRLRHHHGKAEELATRCKVAEIDMVFDDPSVPDRLIDEAITACRDRLLRDARDEAKR
ncbi:tetraacyldisaccharide 4'-kinase [Ciceribacter sp. L1K22]|uniref:tetraacyldisaccharide 4'-kinase n=1 Tax=Ciceribacter sp. L1K22 TaxID=2820275 RepID=UPI001ABE61F8|nr:tetraacyldisaccharide 4'-kinase [Ciceribacter sp. L1K22]MBO3759045.1 tetraacyldisaccharide 4'-kinase [Ciceribacter sp. L1K22]